MCLILPDAIGACKRSTIKTYSNAILHLVGAGRNMPEIAYTLVLPVPTVEACIREIVVTAPTYQIQAAIALLDGLETEVAR